MEWGDCDYTSTIIGVEVPSNHPTPVETSADAYRQWALCQDLVVQGAYNIMATFSLVFASYRRGEVFPKSIEAANNTFQFVVFSFTLAGKRVVTAFAGVKTMILIS